MAGDESVVLMFKKELPTFTCDIRTNLVILGYVLFLCSQPSQMSPIELAQTLS